MNQSQNQISMLQDSTISPLSSDVREAARTIFPDLTEVVAVPEHPEVARVSASTGLWRVRRWPAGTPESDVTFSHEVMRLARGAGLATVPELAAPPADAAATPLRINGRLYDAQRWMPGTAPANAESAWPNADARIDMPVVLPAAVFSALISTLARLHEATTALAATRGIPTAPLHLLPGAVRQAQERQLGTLRAKARHEPSIQRWIATGERLLNGAEPIIDAASETGTMPTSVLHLGLWPAHVLIDNGELSGLLGWERVAAGSPLLDLAQAILRLQGWSDEAVELALGDYGDIRELAPDERRLLPAVAALDAVATTGRLLEQTFASPSPARPPTALRAAIDRLLRSMAALDRSLNAPTDKSRRRVWNRQMPRPGGRPQGGKPRGRPRGRP
jgi:aminoglycoside phosphotransferase (APT) family kinase protein